MAGFEPPRPNLQLRGSHGLYIILPVSGEVVGLGRLAQISGSDAALTHVIITAPGHFSVVQAIRDFYIEWRRLDVTHFTDLQLAARLIADVREPYLAVFYIPDEDKTSVILIARKAGQPVPPPAGPVASWTVAQKLVAMFEAVPNYLVGAARAEFLAMMSPANIAIIAVFMAALVGAQAIPGADAIVDAAIAAIAWIMLGWSGLVAAAHLIGAVIDAGRANSEEDIQKAARAAAAALVTLGLVVFLGRLLKRVKETNAAEANPADGETPAGGKGGPKTEPPLRTIADPDAYVKTRVSQLQQQIPPGSQGRITMAVGVAQDETGAQSVLVGTSEPRGYLRPGVTLDPGETMVSGTGHAEADIVNYAQQNNLTIQSIGATRPVCAGCQSVIPPDTSIVTPLK